MCFVQINSRRLTIKLSQMVAEKVPYIQCCTWRLRCKLRPPNPRAIFTPVILTGAKSPKCAWIENERCNLENKQNKSNQEFVQSPPAPANVMISRRLASYNKIGKSRKAKAHSSDRASGRRRQSLCTGTVSSALRSVQPSAPPAWWSRLYVAAPASSASSSGGCVI